MNKWKEHIVLWGLLCIGAWSAGVQGQTHMRTYNEQIRTLRVERRVLVLNTSNNTSYQNPNSNGHTVSTIDGTSTSYIIDGSEEENTLHISFDEMSHDVHFYSYSVQHMNAEWTEESDLLSNEYLVGFPTQDIVDYEHSINTTREYTHYWFEFPNAEMQLTKSGNYRLTIFEDGDKDKRVGEADFVVVEPLVGIDSRVRNNTDIELSGRYQQLDIDINTSALDVRDPHEVKLFVTQNNRTDNAVWLVQPAFVEPHRLRYINTKALIFEGGNEYHHFDAFSTYYAGTGIDRVFFQNGDYQVVLFADEVAKGQYIHHFDADGCYMVNAERTSDSDVEAEYMWVHWTLPVDKPWFDGALYVGGELFGNEMGLRNRMEYDVEAKCYWLTALVKQGGYDYQYWFKSKELKVESQKSKAIVERVDGSYWQTENEYATYVYWRPFGARYDRLVGVKIQKSAL